MEENDKTGKDEELNEADEATTEEVGGAGTEDLYKVAHISGMYKDWFLDYASYVILERAVPNIYDGLKPVQRRILHSMKRLDDGRYNKVANIIGHTMQFHPHGDASIGDALVQLGQKNLLVDMQGNWGNTLTGDRAAAPRYIEARLSKFALEVVFNPKTTNWKLSYDGRNKEPLTLPMKFPLLLALGTEGIAVGLASKILPHNFNELIDASILYLKGKPFEIFPDFPSGGLADFSKYNDGLRGGAVKVRAKIKKIDKKNLVITELPFGRTTGSLIDSIIKANEKGKIKVKRIDDNTSDAVEIHLILASGVSADKTIDALYAFTDCELSISPNSCVIRDDRPEFLAVSELLKVSVDHTLGLLKAELQIRLNELQEAWHLSSLEKIFIEKKIYRKIEECETWEAVIEAIDKGLGPYKKLLLREVTRDDIIHLTEIRIKRISKYDVKKADQHILGLEEEMESVKHDLAHIVEYTIAYYRRIKKKYGKFWIRKTEIRSFDTIVATKVVAVNTKLFANRKEGFIGTSLKKDEFICECSDIDDIIAIRKDGKYMITKVADKAFVGKNIIHLAVFKKNDTRTIYNIVYQDGRTGKVMIKRAAISGLTRDKEYDLTRGKHGSRIMYFSVNPNGEAEKIKVLLKPRPRMKNLSFEYDFGELAIKGRFSMGNTLTKYGVHKITLKEKGVSTLGGRKIWFDEDVFRLNVDRRGKFLGEFSGDDKILVVSKRGTFRTTNFDLSNHFEEDILIIEKFTSGKIYSVIYYDGVSKYFYLKRFEVEASEKEQNFINDNPDSKLVRLTVVEYPRFEIKFGGKNKDRESEIVEVVEFIGVKSFKAKGKRLSSYMVSDVQEIEPELRKEGSTEKPEDDGSSETEDLDKLKPGQVVDLDPDDSQMTLDL